MLIFTAAVFICCSALLWVLFAIEKRRIRRLEMDAFRQEQSRLNRLSNSDSAESNTQSESDTTATAAPPHPLPGASGNPTAQTLPADAVLPQKLIHTTP